MIVRFITRVSPGWKGALVGTGAIFPLAGLYLGGDETPEPRTAAMLFALGAGTGLVGGLLVDALRERVLYRSASSARIDLTPAITPSGVGVRIAVRW